MEQENETKVNEMTAKVRGQVKWFNSKKGFGFITYKDENKVEKDIFVHHTCIKHSKGTSFRNLVSGEYCEFLVTDCPEKEGQLQAEEVTGIEGGPLMSEIQAQYHKYNPNKYKNSIL